MARSIASKLLLLVPVIVMVSFLTFLMTELQPGDTAIAILGESATPEQIEAVNEQLGLDEPIAAAILRLGQRRTARRPGPFAAIEPTGDGGARASASPSPSRSR